MITKQSQWDYLGDDWQNRDRLITNGTEYGGLKYPNTGLEKAKKSSR